MLGLDGVVDFRIVAVIAGDLIVSSNVSRRDSCVYAPSRSVWFL